MSWWHRADGTIIVHDEAYGETHIITPDDPDHPNNLDTHNHSDSDSDNDGGSDGDER
ncbi:hypothetical protein [Haloechinothrix sp. LS1_15]|uniref:hypothetical protein n=1 Tax=Haloechinothrix sp. LS1_15 TaxID=2652248 RepID=UPI00294B749C|nr:hypothetical protein [Haloechinothrix sp. LS1_15]